MNAHTAATDEQHNAAAAFTVTQAEDGAWLASTPTYPNLTWHGDSPTEALEHAVIDVGYDDQVGWFEVFAGAKGEAELAALRAMRDTSGGMDPELLVQHLAGSGERLDSNSGDGFDQDDEDDYYDDDDDDEGYLENPIVESLHDLYDALSEAHIFTSRYTATMQGDDSLLVRHRESGLTLFVEMPHEYAAQVTAAVMLHFSHDTPPSELSDDTDHHAGSARDTLYRIVNSFNQHSFGPIYSIAFNADNDNPIFSAKAHIPLLNAPFHQASASVGITIDMIHLALTQSDHLTPSGVIHTTPARA